MPSGRSCSSAAANTCAADLVEDDVERLEPTNLVVENRLCRAEAEHVVPLLRRADGADDMCAERRGELNTRAPDTACCRGDEHPRAGSQDDLPGEGDPRREVRQDECRTLLERRRGGKVEQPVVLDGDLLGVPAALHADEADHAAAVGGRAGDLGARARTGSGGGWG